MTRDARFEEAAEAPLNLGALDDDDLGVISALVQDSVLSLADISWRPPARRLALLLNRFRWEDGARPERVRALLVIDNVLGVASQGIDRANKKAVLSVLSVTFAPDRDGAGHVVLTLAGQGALRARVEALDVTLRDVTRPYHALSGRTPDHGL